MRATLNLRLLFALLPVLYLTISSPAKADLKTVSKVDPVELMGNWYELAANPISSRPRDCFCGSETLAIRHDGKMNIHFSCNRGSPSGAVTELQGVATPLDITNSKFTVNFTPSGAEDFWVIGLDSEYRYLVVSDHSGTSLFILSKTAKLDSSLYKKALNEANLQVPVDGLRLDPQAGCVQTP